MGARWAWTAVCCGPEHHVYSNFSGGADDCYECGAEPELEFDEEASGDAQEYAARRRSGVSRKAIQVESELKALRALAKVHGYQLVKTP